MAWLSSLRAALRLRWKTATLGERGERAAARYLRRRGYKIVGSRERDRLGEIDLVAVDGRTIVFVEVKTRRSTDAGEPVEAITPDKQARLSRLALAYLKRHGLLEYRARIDVISVLWPADQKRPTIEHYQNAFEPRLRGSFHG